MLNLKPKTTLEIMNPIYQKYQIEKIEDDHVVAYPYYFDDVLEKEVLSTDYIVLDKKTLMSALNSGNLYVAGVKHNG